MTKYGLPSAAFIMTKGVHTDRNILFGKCLFLVSLFVLFVIRCSDGNKEALNQNQIIFGERIDGPANVRDKINGKILFEIYDNVEVETGIVENDWLEVAVPVSLTKKQLTDFVIPPNTVLTDAEGKEIVKTIDTVELWFSNESNSFGYISGMTYKENIKSESIPEVLLASLLKANKLSKSNFADFLRNYRFESHDVFEFSDFEQYFIHESMVVDMSPRDRITLLFRADKLMAIFHSRNIEQDVFETYDLVRGHKLIVTGSMSPEEIEALIKKRIAFYNWVD